MVIVGPRLEVVSVGPTVFCQAGSGDCRPQTGGGECRPHCFLSDWRM